MEQSHILLPLPPYLSDEAAYYLCDFVYEIAAALENHYARQLKAYYKKVESGYERAYIPTESGSSNC